jgi:pseudouridine-5'-monophosphatase
MSDFPKIQAIIYDMDGLLLDTEGFYTEVTQQIVGRYDKTFDWEIKSQLIGRPAIESARKLVELLELPITPEEYLRERKELLNDRFPDATPMPGAVELTQRMRSTGVPQAVATSSTQPAFALKTRRHQEWFQLFDVIRTGDHPEVKAGKPAPDIFLSAARALHTPPAACLVFEDAPAGVEAALAAGMSVIAVPDPHMDRSMYADAQQCLSSLTEFQPYLWGLST